MYLFILFYFIYFFIIFLKPQPVHSIVIFWLEIRGSGFRADTTANNAQQHPLTWARSMTNKITCSAEEQVC